MKELQIGDKIRVKNIYNDYIVTIHRVTKTKAVGKWKDKKDNEHEMAFKREVYTFPKLYSKIRWDTTDYTLIEQNNDTITRESNQSN